MTDEIADMVVMLFRDPVPEVRAAAVEAVSTLFGSTDYQSDKEKYMDVDTQLGKQVAKLVDDGSSLVRRQVVACLGKLMWWQKVT